jgi:TetR/AcrR family transcriptional repressor of nem operon
MSKATAGLETRNKLLDAAMHVMRLRGYSATTVDDICKAAGVTKGSFFHHFESKEALGLAAAEHFAGMADVVFGDAPYRKLADPLDRVLGYIDFRVAILQGEICDYTCLLGTMVQELYDSNPAIRAACEKHMKEHIDFITKDVAAAKSQYRSRAKWSAESVAFHIQAVLQGSFIYAKVTQGPAVAVESLSHLRRYVQMLFKNESKN